MKNLRKSSGNAEESSQQERETVMSLFLQFLQFGLFTFGGGMSIIAQMQKVYVENKKNVSNEDLLDLTSVGRSLPGTMIGNVAVLFGYQQAGILGGLVCLLGMILPPYIILSIITRFYSAFREQTIVMAAMSGIRASVAPIILSALLRMVNGAYRYKPCIIATATTFILYFFFEVNCVYLVLFGICFGMIISEIYERRGREK